jgi:uncharacterized protein
MPVRSLRSSVLRWPDAGCVRAALEQWASEVSARRPAVRRVGLFGSYARGDWGVGSDLDVVVVVDRSEVPFERRGIEWDTSALPVPTDVLIYTTEEWSRLSGSGPLPGRYAREIVWIVDR